MCLRSIVTMPSLVGHREPKMLGFFVCASVMLLNGKVCDTDCPVGGGTSNWF